MSEYAWFDNGRGRSVYRRVRREAPPARSHLPAPRIAFDSVEVVSMVDGKTYTSKAALRQSYRAHGVEEVGNERLPDPVDIRPEGVRDDLMRAVAQHS